MAREADEIVQKLKAKVEKEVNQILSQTSTSFSSQTSHASLNQSKTDVVPVKDEQVTVESVIDTKIIETNVVDNKQAPINKTISTKTSPTLEQEQHPVINNNNNNNNNHNNNSSSNEQEKLIKQEAPVVKTKKTKPKCGCVLS